MIYVSIRSVGVQKMKGGQRREAKSRRGRKKDTSKTTTNDPLRPRRRLWELRDMTSAKFSDFSDPLPSLSAFGTDLYYKILATPFLRPLFHDPTHPSDADIIPGSSLGPHGCTYFIIVLEGKISCPHSCVNSENPLRILGFNSSLHNGLKNPINSALYFGLEVHSKSKSNSTPC